MQNPHHRVPATDPLEVLHHELRQSRPELQGLLEAAEALRDDPGLLLTSLTSLIDDVGQLQLVAARSSDHPNSFAKIVLQTGGGYGIRLHVWRRRDQKVQPHGHRWEFASWVVTGTIRETTFAEADGDDRYVRTTYQRDEDGIAHHGGPAVTVPLRRVDEIDHCAGTVYARKRSVLHTAVPLGRGPVASLVLQRPASLGPTRVYSRPDTRQPTEARLLPDDVRNLVTGVVEAIR